MVVAVVTRNNEILEIIRVRICNKKYNKTFPIRRNFTGKRGFGENNKDGTLIASAVGQHFYNFR